MTIEVACTMTIQLDKQSHIQRLHSYGIPYTNICVYKVQLIEFIRILNDKQFMHSAVNHRHTTI